MDSYTVETTAVLGLSPLSFCRGLVLGPSPLSVCGRAFWGSCNAGGLLGPGVLPGGGEGEGEGEVVSPMLSPDLRRLNKVCCMSLVTMWDRGKQDVLQYGYP